MSAICSPFSNWRIISNFSSVLLVFGEFSQGDIDLYFSLILVTEANAPVLLKGKAA